MKLGEMIDEMYELREQRRKLAEQDKKIKEKFQEIETKVRQKMEELGIPSAIGHKARATQSQQTFANPTESWEDVWEWAKETDSFYIFKKSLNSASCVEMQNQGDLPDCITIGHKTTLNLRKTA